MKKTIYIYFMSYKRWILVATFLFSIGMAFGLTIGLAAPTGVAGFISEDIAALEELADLLASLPLALVAIIIFTKNASVLLLSFAFSPIFCLLPVLSLIFNGGIVGFISLIVSQEESIGFVLAGLLPHGIFELPAFILGQAAALSFGTGVMLALFRKGRRNQLLPGVKQDLRYLMIALALLLPAAIIETYVTPLLLT